MSQAADLYTILRFYANRTRTPSFTVESFIGFLDKYAKRYMAERPDLAPWAEDTARKVHNELPTIAESGKCALSTNEKGLIVTVNQYFVDLVQQAFKTVEEMTELPFPDEASLKIVIPSSQLRNVSMELDLENYMASPQGAPLPILKLGFPDGAGSIILLSGMIPKKILELALLKARHYLRSHNNKEYVLHKLAPAFQGKESMLKDAVNQLLVRPFDSMSEMEKAGDFSFPFWAYFASLVKGDIRKKNDLLPEDIAVMQSVLLIEYFNNYYKGKAQKAREAETALRNLDLALDKAPFYFTIDDIIRFTDTKGVPLLGQYSQEALETFIKLKTTQSAGLDQLPDLLITHGLNQERWYVKKSKLLPLCVKLLGDARPRVKTAITQRWFKLKAEFRSDPSMEDDDSFDHELADLTDNFAPVLSALLQEKTLYLVHEELDGTEAGIPEASRLFYKGALAPLSDLYLLSRKDLLTDVRMLLPFWHTIPLFSGIIAFFKRMGQKKPKQQRRVPTVNQFRIEEPATRDEGNEAQSAKSSANERKAALKKAALAAQKKLVPTGYTLDVYLSELEERWNRIINPDLKENLTEDVNSLIRDYLRRTARSLKAATFTNERIEELARTLAESPNLVKIQARDSLRLYIQLYMINLVIKS
ncbi:MAG: hypothetical protein WCT14_06655 [Treponemataceae bacterium]